MAKNMQPIAKRCRTLGISPAVMGYSKKESNRNPGAGSRRKKSEYGLQLNEKQKVKFIYGILEKQFRAYYEKAIKMPGKTGENLLITVERRLDNAVYRAGFASTRREARQLVTHGHYTINGKRVNIPSYLVSPGEVIAISEKSMESPKFKSILEPEYTVTAKWLSVDKAKGVASVVDMPARSDIDFEVEENSIVELYSK